MKAKTIVRIIWWASLIISWLLGVLYRYLTDFDYESHHPIEGGLWVVLGGIPIFIILFLMFIGIIEVRNMMKDNW
jgi:small-conductance mechanosensitive channel